MAGEVIIVVIAAAIFAAGIAAGAIVVVSMGIRREEREFARTGRSVLTGQALGPASHAGRLLTGLYVRERSDAPAGPALRQDLLV